MNDINIFIEFEIIKNSNILELKDEFDKLIAGGKKIYIWSKIYQPQQIREYCQNIKIKRSSKEINDHSRSIELRKQNKSYSSIAEELNIDVNKVSYYLNTTLFEAWKLDDWITNYYTKDSAVYSKVDIVVDNDQKVVNRFKRTGHKATLINKL